MIVRCLASLVERRGRGLRPAPPECHPYRARVLSSVIPRTYVRGYVMAPPRGSLSLPALGAARLFNFAAVGVQVVEEAKAEAEVGAGEFSGECFEWAFDAAVGGAF